MNYDAFVQKYNGKPVEFDGVYGAQCVDLVAVYCRENGKPVAYANAKDWWGNPAVAGGFDFIKNNPADLKQVPKKGDIIIWGGNLAGSGGYGHIAIFDSVVSPGVFKSFDQNWGGQYAHFVNHGWNNVIGWLTPKSAPQGGDEMIADATQATQAYKMLRPNAGGSPAEIAATAGKRTWAEFAASAQREVEIRDASLRSQSDQLGQMQGTINQLNQTITAVSGDATATKAQLQDALAKAADLTSQLETSHDTITDLQKQVEEAQKPQPEDPSVGAFKQVVAFIRKLLNIK